jgi:O-antigen ligase
MVVLAVALAPLVAYSQTPSSTLFNQLAAVFGWGLVLWFGARASMEGLRLDGPALALLLLLAAPFASAAWNQLPMSLALESGALILAALLVYLAGAGIHESLRIAAFRWLCWGLLLAGVLSLIVSLTQVFAPDWANGWLIARSGLPGRAIGNMRQPNHLASLMMWACVAAAYLCDQKQLGRVSAFALPALLFAFVFTIVLSASRTGMGGIALLLIWGLVDGSLKRSTRVCLVATPLMLGLSWWLMAQWASAGHVFGAETRLESEGAGSPSRLAILTNAWELVKHNPWTGVGWGEFNLAWTMTPFPNRPVAFFDHTHNILMQLAVELGLPLALLVTALLLWGLGRSLWAGVKAQGAEATMRRSAVMVVLTIGVHSLLEYPLWYAYFLLPGAFAMGLAAVRSNGIKAPQRWAPHLLETLGAVLIAGSLYAVWDYSRVTAIYSPPEHASSLLDRVRAGQRSAFFAVQADYAAATSLPDNPHALDAARRTAHNLIDIRLMMDWAEALHEAGDDERARYVAARLREFHNSQSDEWFEPCKLLKADADKPFQCDPPKREFSWREMR